MNAAPLLGVPRRPQPPPPKRTAPLTADEFLGQWAAIDAKRAEREW